MPLYVILLLRFSTKLWDHAQREAALDGLRSISSGGTTTAPKGIQLGETHVFLMCSEAGKTTRMEHCVKVTSFCHPWKR